MFDRYFTILEKTLDLAWQERRSRPDELSSRSNLRGAIPIEPYAWALVAKALGKRTLAISPIDLNTDTKVIDANGHARQVYRGLVFHAQKMIAAESEMPSIPSDRIWSESISPSSAELLVSQVWFNLDDAAWSDCQLPSGALIENDSTTNPETAWYAEMILLHALTTSACLKRDPVLLDRAKRGASYVAREIQPDHASTQPWAIHAMLLDESTLSLADFMLHAAGVQQPSAMNDVSILLLADALLGLKRIFNA